jgi:radical SAM superfamily enzyme YgiQ (UPF0313 family)
MYKTKQFQIKPLEQILSEIQWAADRYPEARRIFLADGDALAIPFDDLQQIIKAIKASFPHLQRISSYANALNILEKTPEQLSALYHAGLGLLYLGLESGDPQTLLLMHKGSTPAENIQAVQRAQAAGMAVSVMVILGLGGVERSREHALASAKAVSQMKPKYLSALTLYLAPDVPLYRMVEQKKFTPITPEMTLNELYLLISHIEGKNIIFRSNHASNYLPLSGRLAQDREYLLGLIKDALKSHNLKPDFLRGL